MVTKTRNIMSEDAYKDMASQLGMIYRGDWEPLTNYNLIKTDALWQRDLGKFISPINNGSITTGATFNPANWVITELLTLAIFNVQTVIINNGNSTDIINALVDYPSVSLAGDITIDRTVTIPAGKSVVSIGMNANCNITGNFRAFALSSNSKSSGLSFIGSGKNSGLTDQTAYYVNANQYGSSVSNVKFSTLGGSCYSGGSVVGHHAGNSISNYSMDLCNIGLDIAERFEFVHTSQGSITRCNIGTNIIGGNFCGGGGVVVSDNELGIKIGIGSNDSHGHCAGWTVNHNVKTMEYTAPSNGFEFDGCEFWNAGPIHLIDCENARFNGGIISTVPIWEEGCTKCYFNDVDFGTGLSNLANYNGKPSEVYYSGYNLDSNMLSVKNAPNSLFTYGTSQSSKFQLTEDLTKISIGFSSVLSVIRANVNYSIKNPLLSGVINTVQNVFSNTSWCSHLVDVSMYIALSKSGDSFYTSKAEAESAGLSMFIKDNNKYLKCVTFANKYSDSQWYLICQFEGRLVRSPELEFYCSSNITSDFAVLGNQRDIVSTLTLTGV